MDLKTDRLKRRIGSGERLAKENWIGKRLGTEKDRIRRKIG